jgi:hypothetical protein
MVKFILLFLLLSSSVFAQDTLTLVNKKDSTVEYKLPLNRYNIKIKPYHSKQFFARIVGFTDSTITYRQYKIDRSTKDSIRNYYENFYARGLANKLTLKQIDSAKFYINDTIFEIRHSLAKDLSYDKIKLLKINNHDRPEMQKAIKTVGTIALVSGLASAILSLREVKDVDAAAGIAYGITLTSFIVYLNLESKSLCLKKWKVKNSN